MAEQRYKATPAMTRCSAAMETTPTHCLNDGNDVITDTGSGGDQIVILTSTPLNSTSISALNFEQTGMNLAINVGSTLIVVRDQYAGTGAEIETVTFSNGGTIYGYQLNTTGYKISTDTSSPLDGGGNEDIIASTINGQALTGGKQERPSVRQRRK